MNDLNIKRSFENWLEKNKGLAVKTKSGRPGTVYEYIKRIDRLSEKLYETPEAEYRRWENLIYDINSVYIIFMKPIEWLNISRKNVCAITQFLYKYKKKNRNFNDQYNHCIKQVGKENFEHILSNYYQQQYSDKRIDNLLEWIKNTFANEKVLLYFQWLWKNKSEKRKIYVALTNFYEFLLETKPSEDSEIYSTLNFHLLNYQEVRKIRGHIKIIEANGNEAKNFYAINQGRVNKTLSTQEVSAILDCHGNTLRRLLKKGKLHHVSETSEFSIANLRRFLKRRHTKRKPINELETCNEKKKENWLPLQKAADTAGCSATHLRKLKDEGRVAFTRYGLKKTLYFVPDLLKIREEIRRKLHK